MEIIDAHTHIGDSRFFDLNISEDELMQTMDKNGIQTSLVQPFPGASNHEEVHKRIYKLSKKYPGRIYGIISLDPHKSSEKFRQQVRLLVEEFGFVGIKLHPVGHVVTPLTKDGQLIFKVAEELKIPVIIHTGGYGIPATLPSLCIPRLKEHPGIDVVLAHAGTGFFTQEAVLVAELYDNVFLETSLCRDYEIREVMKGIKTNRIMFGSDGVENVGTSLYQYRTLGLESQELQECLGLTAKRVFKL